MAKTTHTDHISDVPASRDPIWTGPNGNPSAETIDETTGEVLPASRDPIWTGPNGNPGAGQAVAVHANANIDPFGADDIVVKRRVSVVPLSMKLAEGQSSMSVVCRLLGRIEEGKEIKEGKRGPRMGKALVVMVQSRTGEVRSLVLGTLLAENLSDSYPKDSYIGRWFHVQKHAAKTAADGVTKYSPYTITEIEVPRGAVELDLAEFASPAAA